MIYFLVLLALSLITRRENSIFMSSDQGNLLNNNYLVSDFFDLLYLVPSDSLAFSTLISDIISAPKIVVTGLHNLVSLILNSFHLTNFSSPKKNC